VVQFQIGLGTIQFSAHRLQHGVAVSFEAPVLRLYRYLRERGSGQQTHDQQREGARLFRSADPGDHDGSGSFSGGAAGGPAGASGDGETGGGAGDSGLGNVGGPVNMLGTQKRGQP